MSNIKQHTLVALTVAVLAVSAFGTDAQAHKKNYKHTHKQTHAQQVHAQQVRELQRRQAANRRTAQNLQVQQAQVNAQANANAAASRRLDAAEQRALIQRQQAQVIEYRRTLDAQKASADAMAQTLEQQRRMQQAQYVQQYNQRMWEQQQQYRAQPFNYENDPYFQSAPNYSYTADGRTYQTNEYGAKMLREAINTGYQEGLNAGRADAMDHTQADYRNSYAYQEPYYGYNGYYLDKEQYAYSFRQGFQRGYDDGFYQRSQYRSSATGTEIMDSLLNSILNMRSN